jgi:hypothetical protein
VRVSAAVTRKGGRQQRAGLPTPGARVVIRPPVAILVVPLRREPNRRHASDRVRPPRGRGVEALLAQGGQGRDLLPIVCFAAVD